MSERSRPVLYLDKMAASPIEVAAGSLIGFAAAFIAMVWGAGVASSWLVNGTAASIGLNDAALAMVRLGRNRLSWEGVWSPEIEAQLAGPGWFWLVFAIELLIVCLLFWPVWQLIGPRPGDPPEVTVRQPKENNPRTARRRAAREAESNQEQSRTTSYGSVDSDEGFDKILISEPDGRRLVLGRSGRQLVATEKNHSVIVFGPTQSGKTSGLTVPAVLEWDGPIVAAVAKADLLPLVWDERAERGGQSWLFDPTSSGTNALSGDRPRGTRQVTPSNWSPLHVIQAVPQPRNEAEIERGRKRWTLARRSARWMIGATHPAGEALSGERSVIVAEQLLAPLLFAAAAQELPMSRVAEWVSRRESAEVLAALDRAGVKEAVATWEGGHRHDPSTVAASYQTLTVVMYPYGDATVLGRSREAGISAAKLLDGNPNSLFIVSPSNQQDRLRPLFTTLIAEMIDEAMSTATMSARGRLDPPLLIILDDVASCVPPALLDQLASVGAGLGIQLMTLFQDLGQVERAIGANDAIQLANNHRARVALPGISDGATLNYMDSLVRGIAGAGAGSAAWLRTLEDGEAVCVYGNLPPAMMTLRYWYDDERLRNRVEPPPEPARRFRLPRRQPSEPSMRGFPNPFDSNANDREAARYWEAVQRDGTLPNPTPYNDGSQESSDTSNYN